MVNVKVPWRRVKVIWVAQPGSTLGWWDELFPAGSPSCWMSINPFASHMRTTGAKPTQ